MKGDILLIGYTNEQSRFIVSQLESKDSILLWNPRIRICENGQKIIPSCWYGSKSSPRLLLNGYRLDQVIIADDSRMKILPKVFPFLPELYAACSHSEIPVDFQISILNIDVWDSEFIEKWVGYKF